MSEETQAVLAAAVETYVQARAVEAEPDRSDVDAAASAHLAAVDPGYAERAAGLDASDRIAAPDLKAAYDKALEAHQAKPTAASAAKVAELGEELSAARQAQRIAEGRPIAATVGG